MFTGLLVVGVLNVQKGNLMGDAVEEARRRVVAYLAEIERVNRANDYMRSSYADAVHSINDYELRRSDLLLILGSLTRDG